ncbi:MAG: thermonuclease family protein, partial [Oscillospiraceae bacterium]|nr:thermonuclease family protein [Oscillospiraceae bacterium]
FLSDKFKGRRVFMKHDAVKYDNENRLLAYLYLDNKTFINAHLLKAGYALVDNSIPFRLADKFANLRYGACSRGERMDFEQRNESVSAQFQAQCRRDK